MLKDRSQSTRAARPRTVLAAVIVGVALSAVWSPLYGQTKPRIGFVTTGGTIANRMNPDGTSTRLTLRDTMAEIRARYPQPSVAAVLDSIDFTDVEVTRVGSSSFDLKEFLGICLAAQKAISDGVDAVIVTQGTVMSEESVYFLNLLVGGDAPIVLVNSQIQHMDVGNDGDLNLLNAIMVASAKASRGKTVLVENQKILAAREVLKGSDIPGGFSGGVMGPLGWVGRPEAGYTAATADTFVTYYRAPVRKGRATSEFSIRDLVTPDGSFEPLPRVEVLAGHYGGQVDVIDAFMKLGVQGLVITGLPPTGRSADAQAARLQELETQGIPIVHSSRNAAQFQNRVGPSTNLRIEGDNLPWQTARVILQLAMHKTAKQGLTGAARLAEIQRLIYAH
jgi:L-asparaginase